MLVLALLVAAGVAVFAVVREIKKPLSSTDEGTGQRLSPKECAAAIAELARPGSDGRMSAEARTRLRQCFEKK